MLKKIYAVIKKIVFAFLMLYGLNYFISSLQIYISINVITVGVVSLLGITGLSSLIILYFIVK